MKSRAVILLAGALVVLLAAGLLSPRNRPANPVEAADGPKDAKQKADDEAVRKTSADFAAAVAKGDAKAVAAFWTDNGEYIGEDGTTLRGRAAIEAAYAKHFAKHKNLKLETTVESIRFPSRDTAIEEGYAKSFRDNAEHATTSRYSVLHVRENDRWLMAVLREWPDEGVALRDLDWLIGTWAAKTELADVTTTYEWGEKKNAIHMRFTIKEGDSAHTGTQIILKDPRNGQLRAWQFDSEGSFGDSTWSRDGKRWKIEANGIQSDGGELSATNILTPVDKDTFTWQSIDRTLDGEALPDIAPIKVKRVNK